MSGIPEINASDYLYDLPKDKIAFHPLKERNSSKLAVLKDNNINEYVFKLLPDIAGENGLFVFNDTKVVPARLIFRKETGACVEIFCLEPFFPADYSDALAAKGSATWLCLIGNKKRWKNSSLSTKHIIDNREIILSATLVENKEDSNIIKFEWNNNDITFHTILKFFGKVPLPPYINREATEEDVTRYQTVYAQNGGSVAAPTAGLHFTPGILLKLKENNFDIAKITLHVGAGTFRPVSEGTAAQHKMHHEWVNISAKTVEKLLNNAEKSIIPVGTTSVRSIESLYWFGVNLLSDNRTTHFNIEQWQPYYNNFSNNIKREDALNAVLNYMKSNSLESISGNTKLMIVPGYKYKMTDAMITNFHQPGSTLLMLVAAFIGDKWKDVYSYALKNNFRFLSYGDACLFYPHHG